MGELAVSIEHSEAESVSARAPRARHGPPLPNPKYVTENGNKHLRLRAYVASMSRTEII